MRYQPDVITPEILNEDNLALSQEADIRRYLEGLFVHYYRPITRQWANPAIRFSNLKEEWGAETAALSSVTDISMHPAYQQIIGMGPIVIALILSEMVRKPGHWFWALKSITGEDPVSPEQRGRINEMTEAWLSWGREQRYIE